MGTQRPTAQVVRRDSSGLALSRYPIQAASYMLPGFGESPRLGFQALCAIARWLGSRHEQTSVCECLGDAVATTAAWGRSAVGAAGPAADPEPLERGGDR